MAFSVKDLKLPADKQGQLNRALGGAANDQANAALQTICDQAAAVVARMTAGYVIDAVSLADFTRSVALYRAYGEAGPVPKDIEKNYTDAWTELQAIAAGKRPNLPKTNDAALSGRAGAWGSGQATPGRMPAQFPDQSAPAPLVNPTDPELGTL